jgi:hypothetical protein
MGCTSSVHLVHTEPVNHSDKLPLIRHDMLTSVGLEPIHEFDNKPAYNIELPRDKNFHFDNVNYCHLCREKGIYYTGRLFIESEQNLRNRIKYICTFHLERKNILNTML